MMRRLLTMVAILGLCGPAVAGGAEAPPPPPTILPSGDFTAGTPPPQVRQLADEVGSVLGDRRMEGAVDLHQAWWPMGDALRAAPNDPRVQRVYGRLLIEEVRYAEAAQAFQKALAINPRDQQAQAGLAQARRLSRVIRSLPLHLSRRWRVFRLAEVPGGARPGVIVLVGRTVRYEGPPGRDEVSIATPEVRYFARGKQGYRETFRTRRIAGLEPAALSENQLEYARFWVGDFQHTGRPQVLLVSGWIGADWLPTFVDIFEARPGSVRHLLHVASDDTAQWVDLDHNQRPQVQTVHLVGRTMARAEYGAWCDVYRYDGRRYARANGHFRAYSREQLDDMLDMNKRFPHDPDVLARIAQAYRDLGETAQAWSYDRQAREAKERSEE